MRERERESRDYFLQFFGVKINKKKTYKTIG